MKFRFSYILVLTVIHCLYFSQTLFGQKNKASKPNFIIIFTDDQGYGDLSSFGGSHIETPHIDAMAKQGMKLTSFYVAAPVCTPSRAALMTGSYPVRNNMAYGSNFGVLLAADKKGLNPDEITIAEILKTAGYATGIFGKWHLGDQPEFLPTKQGFDEFFGIPYSHDIHPFHPQQSKYNFPDLPLLEGEEVVEMNPDADFLTQRITNKAVSFIKTNKEKPFFLYLPHPLPHRPLHVSPAYMKEIDTEILDSLKKEKNSINYKLRDRIFKQAIREIDTSVGQILKTLKETGTEKNTFVIFTSDNGPAVGSSGPLKGRKGATFEGGMREPTVVYWPGKIPAGKTNDEVMTTMDLLPTFAKLSGASIPKDRVIDGMDIWSTLIGKSESPHDSFFYHKGKDLNAIRSGSWKLHVNVNNPIALYDLENDIAESKNILEYNQEIVLSLLKKIELFKDEIGKNSRPAAFVENPVPLKLTTK